MTSSLLLAGYACDQVSCGSCSRALSSQLVLNVDCSSIAITAQAFFWPFVNPFDAVLTSLIEIPIRGITARHRMFESDNALRDLELLNVVC
jgi:hypothetical protein